MKPDLKWALDQVVYNKEIHWISFEWLEFAEALNIEESLNEIILWQILLVGHETGA